MKKKELKNLAQKIANFEKILLTNPEQNERQRIEYEIIKLSGKVHSLEEIMIVDELVQEILKKS